jgi:ankyrin repeat protein
MALLHAVAEEGKLLLEQREDINGRNASNQTPLKRAVERGNLDIVRYSSRLTSQLLT